MHHLIVLLIAALVPLIVGSAWYSPMLFAKPWMAAVGLSTEQRPSGGMMARNMILLYILSILVAFGLQFMVIHQYHLSGILMNDPGFKEGTGDAHLMYQNFMHTYGNRFRSYHHGALCGFTTAIVFALPLIASGAIFEKRSIKYVAITFGFWLINFILMGAIICHWAPERFM